MDEEDMLIILAFIILPCIFWSLPVYLVMRAIS